MRMALTAAAKVLEQGEFPVGCVLVHDHRVLVDAGRSGTRRQVPSELAHAEMIALGRLEQLAPDLPRQDMTLYCTLEPCLMCFGAILLSGVGRLVYAYEDAMGGAASCDRANLRPLYADHGIQIVGGVCREESLALFQAFFRDPGLDYWRGSLLAQYTLSQKSAVADGKPTPLPDGRPGRPGSGQKGSRTGPPDPEP